MNRRAILIFLLCVAFGAMADAQCLSSVNPVGGTENLLVLEKNALRIISFYKYGQGKHYFEKDSRSDFSLIRKAQYNYLSGIIGYGLSHRITLETEFGYYINKSQHYATEPEYTLTGRGLTNLVVSSKVNLYTNHIKRVYFSAAGGVKIPFSRTPQEVDHVELPVEVQPTIGAYGFVFSSYFVKENSERALRFFITNRVETNLRNPEDYHLGTAVFTSFFVSKHLMFQWLKGDWTTILQFRNEIRTHDHIGDRLKESSGGAIFLVAPQINYVVQEKWYLSAMADIPVYQYFNGTQLGAGIGATLSLSRTFSLGAGL
ncbi:MAG: hypothetical protein JXR41_11960 [Bacteroidales bacterium]|nr:hypothetical protein [Bacteroidales bacterium]MBN2763799.1 hypothetical protein [Bacteroidales bacterium]